MAFGDYSRLFDLSGDQMRRRRSVFGGMQGPDLFGGSSQHQQAVAEQSGEPGIAESLIGAAGTVGRAYMNRPQKGPASAGDVKLNPESKAPPMADLGSFSTIIRPDASPAYPGGDPYGPGRDDPGFTIPTPPGRGPFPFGGYRAYGGMMYPGRRYRVGDEDVYMNPDGTAQVVPGDNPAATARRERGVPPTRQEEIIAGAPSAGVSTQEMLDSFGGATTPAFNPYDDPARPPWNRQGPTGLPSPATAGRPANIEPSPYDGRARDMLDDDATPRERALQEIQDLQRAGPRSQRQSSLWKRLGQGILGGLSEWAAAGMPGDLGGALGAVGAGAAIYGAAPGTAAEMEHRRKLAGLFGKYKEAVAPEMAEMERLGEMQKAQGVGLDNQRKRLDMLHKTYGPLMDQMERAGKTPEEIAAFLTSQGIPMVAQDVRERKVVYDAKGQAVGYTTKGPIEAEPVDSLPINYDERRSPLTVNVPGSDPVTGVVSDAKKMDTIVGIQEGNARLKEQRENRTRMQSNADRDYELRRKQFDLDVQREGRLKEEARLRYEGKDSETYKRRVDDLDKARRVVNDLRAEHDGLTRIPEEDRTEAQKAKLGEIEAKERNALMYYNEILDRLQKGQ